MKEKINIEVDKKEKFKNDMIMLAIVSFTVVVAIFAIFFIKPKRYDKKEEPKTDVVEQPIDDTKTGIIFEKINIAYDGSRTTLVTKIKNYDNVTDDIKFSIIFFNEAGERLNKEEFMGFAGMIERGKEVEVTSFFIQNYSNAYSIKYEKLEG